VTAAAPLPRESPSLRRAFQDLAPHAADLQGRRAGIVSRGAAFAIDFVVVFAGYPVLVWIYGAVVALLHFTTPAYPTLPAWVEVALPLTWNWLYFTGSWIVTGRTIGMTVMGLKVVARHRRQVGIVQANIRFVLLFSTLLWIGPLWLACSRSRLAIQDRVAHTQVVYDGSSRRREVAVTQDRSGGVGPPAPVAAPGPLAPPGR